MYSKYNKNDLILRDNLAIWRNIMANERTLLSYLNAWIAFIIAGTTIIKLFLWDLFWFFGFVVVAIWFLFIFFWIISYNKRKKEIDKLIKK